MPTRARAPRRRLRPGLVERVLGSRLLRLLLVLGFAVASLSDANFVRFEPTAAQLENSRQELLYDWEYSSTLLRADARRRSLSLSEARRYIKRVAEYYDRRTPRVFEAPASTRADCAGYWSVRTHQIYLVTPVSPSTCLHELAHHFSRSSHSPLMIAWCLRLYADFASSHSLEALWQDAHRAHVSIPHPDTWGETLSLIHPMTEPNKFATARVNVYLGGTRKALAWRPDITGAHLHVYIDAETEFEPVAHLFPPNAIALCLGERQTVESLSRDDPKFGGELESLLTGTAVPLATGMGGRPALGASAARVLLESPHFTDWVRRDVYDRVKHAMNGEVPRLELGIYMSGSGGTASGAAHEIVPVLASELKKTVPHGVFITWHFTGPATYTGIAPYAVTNSARCLSTICAKVAGKERMEGIFSRAQLHEAPLLGNDTPTRDTLARQLSAVESIPYIREVLDREDPNFAARRHEWGGISLHRAAWYRPVPESFVASDLAKDYASPLKRILEAPPDPDAVQRSALELGPSAPTTARHTENLKAELETVETAAGAARLIEHAARPSVTFPDGYVSFELRDYEDPEVIQLGRTWRGIAAEWRVDPVTRKWRLLTALLERLDTQLGYIDADLEDAGDDHQDALEAAMAAVPLAFPDSPLQKVRSAFTNFEDAIELIGARMAELQECANRVEELERRRAVVRWARSEVGTELENLELDLNTIFSALKSLRLRRDSHYTGEFVFGEHIDQVFTVLLAASRESPAKVKEVMIRSCVVEVTAHALAYSVEASDDHVGSIAEGMVNGKPTWRSPGWGGAPMVEPSHRFVAHPPVNAKLRADLEAALELLDPGFELVEMLTASAGAVIVKWSLHRPTERCHVFTPETQTALDAAAANESPAPPKREDNVTLELSHNGADYYA